MEKQLTTKRITFDVPGVPVAKGRGRAYVRTVGGHARAGVYTPEKTRRAEESFAARAIGHRPAQPISGPIAIDVLFVLPVPASWSAKKRATVTAHTSRPDLDNLLKLFKDALNGVFWLDDRQIFSVQARKVYGAVPQTVVSITFNSEGD